MVNEPRHRPRHALDSTIDAEPVDKEKNVRLVASSYINMPLSDSYRRMMTATCCRDRAWACEAVGMRRDTCPTLMAKSTFSIMR